MPIYLFSNPANPQEVVEVIQTMNEKHEYFVEGVQWERVFTIPQATIDAKLDPFSETAFVDKLGKSKGVIGDTWARSAELSAQRAEKCGGEDPIKRKKFDDYKKKTKGKESFHEIKERQNKTITI